MRRHYSGFDSTLRHRHFQLLIGIQRSVHWCRHFRGARTNQPCNRRCRVRRRLRLFPVNDIVHFSPFRSRTSLHSSPTFRTLYPFSLSCNGELRLVHHTGSLCLGDAFPSRSCPLKMSTHVYLPLTRRQFCSHCSAPKLFLLLKNAFLPSMERLGYANAKYGKSCDLYYLDRSRNKCGFPSSLAVNIFQRHRLLPRAMQQPAGLHGRQQSGGKSFKDGRT